MVVVLTFIGLFIIGLTLILRENQRIAQEIQNYMVTMYELTLGSYEERKA